MGMDAWLEWMGWIARAHHPGGLGAHGYCAGTNHGPFADLNAWAHKGLGADPGIGTNRDRLGEERKGGGGVIVRAGAQVGTLRYDYPFTELNQSHGVAVHARADAGLGGHHQIPGSPDAGVAVDVAPGGNACPEATQQPAAPGVQGRRRGAEQQQPHQLPGQTGQAIAAAKTGALLRIWMG